MSLRAHIIGLVSSAAGGGVDSYAVLGNGPDVVADFEIATEYFRVGGTETTFASMFDLGTTTAYPTTLGTMVDSDGVLKWTPHNLLTNSGNFTGWTLNAITSVTDNIVIPNTSDNWHFVQLASASVVHDYTWEFEAKPEGYNFVRLFMGLINVGVDLDLVNRTFSNKSSELSNPIITESTDGYVRVVCEYIGTRTNKAMALMPMPSALFNATWTGDGVSGVRFRNLSMFRSDLGGMVNNPDRGDSYVPTTTAARYLHRRGNHTWNGSAWVKKGILLETEARTNLVLYSRVGSGGVNDWNGNTSTFSALSGVAPDGSTNGIRVTTTGNSGLNLSRAVSALTIGVAYTASLWLKGTAGEQIYFFADDAADAQELITFTGGWQRVHKTFVATATAQYIGCERFNRSGGDHLPDVVFEAWGGQYEAGSTPSSYIPTAGTTVTRAAEALTIPAANMSYSATAMSFQMNGELTAATGFPIFFRWGAGVYFDLYAGMPQGDVALRNDPVHVIVLSAVPAGINQAYNLAGRLTPTELQVASAGAGSSIADPPGSPPVSASAFNLGLDYNGNIGRFRQWGGVDITDAGIEAATS